MQQPRSAESRGQLCCRLCRNSVALVAVDKGIIARSLNQGKSIVAACSLDVLTSEQYCPCKQPALSAISNGSEVTFSKPLVTS
ncbi:hypothetical protein J6590_021309 [Homalodisca vitripennis]|nr:hypothetical protein J6590_021309 [Homalodisca vitripennis]